MTTWKKTVTVVCRIAQARALNTAIADAMDAEGVRERITIDVKLYDDGTPVAVWGRWPLNEPLTRVLRRLLNDGALDQCKWWISGRGDLQEFQGRQRIESRTSSYDPRAILANESLSTRTQGR